MKEKELWETNSESRNQEPCLTWTSFLGPGHAGFDRLQVKFTGNRNKWVSIGFIVAVDS